MGKAAKLVAYTFYTQLGLLAIGALVFWQGRNSNSLNGLYSLFELVPALILAPFIVIASLIAIIKQARPPYVIIFAFCVNIMLSFIFFFRVVLAG